MDTRVRKWSRTHHPSLGAANQIMQISWSSVGGTESTFSEPSDVPKQRQNRKKASENIFRQFQSPINLGEVLRSFPFDVNSSYRWTREGKNGKRQTSKFSGSGHTNKKKNTIWGQTMMAQIHTQLISSHILPPVEHSDRGQSSPNYEWTRSLRVIPNYLIVSPVGTHPLPTSVIVHPPPPPKKKSILLHVCTTAKGHKVKAICLSITQQGAQPRLSFIECGDWCIGWDMTSAVHLLWITRLCSKSPFSKRLCRKSIWVWALNQPEHLRPGEERCIHQLQVAPAFSAMLFNRNHLIGLY